MQDKLEAKRKEIQERRAYLEAENEKIKSLRKANLDYVTKISVKFGLQRKKKNILKRLKIK